MKQNILTSMLTVAIWLIVISVGLTHSTEFKIEPNIKFQSYPMPTDFGCVDAVGKALDFDKWPQTKVRHVAPPIDKTLLSNPDLVTRQSTYYHAVPFGQDPWGQCNWSWGRLVKNTEPLPTDLPAERKARLLERMSPEKRNDPNFVAEYLKRKLDGYRMSKTYRSEGQMDVYLCIAPNSRAAQEYMLAVMTHNTLPTGAVVSMYSRAKRPESLGTKSFLTESSNKDDIRVKFVRDNVFLKISGNGCFADEVLQLARKIDTLLVKQPPLTYQQLLGRRPSITIAANAAQTTSRRYKTVPYDISVPAGKEVVSVRTYVNGKNASAKDGKIFIGEKKGKVKVKLTAITSELLANSFERELIID